MDAYAQGYEHSACKTGGVKRNSGKKSLEENGAITD